MNDKWSSRYAGVTMALLHHTNFVCRTMSFKIDRGEGIFLSHQQTQILELVIEYRHENLTMSDFARILGLSKSMMSQSSKLLEKNGLVERYHLNDNRKAIILKPTEKGVKLFNNYIESTSSRMFEPLFSKLSALTDEQLKIVEEAIYELDSHLENTTEEVLSKVEK